MDWKNRIVEQREILVADLTANPGNWRKHPRAQQQALQGMISEVGMVQGVVFNKRTGRLVDGHLRVELARKAGVESLPVTVVDLDETEEQLVLATLDPIGAMAGQDDQALGELIKAVGLHHDRAIASIIDDLARRVPRDKPAEPDSDKKTPLDEVAEKWNVQEGELWTIPSLATAGKSHRILCGDSTKEADVARLMGDERAVLFATDPPYAIEYTGRRSCGFGATKGQGKDWGEAYAETTLSASEMYSLFVGAAVGAAVTRAAPWYCWHANTRRNAADLIDAWEAAGATVHQEIVWLKTRSAFGRCIYRPKHEPCLVGWIKGEDPRRATGSPRMAQVTSACSVWEFPAPNNRGLHPTMKPVELFEIPMQMHTLQGELCYEPFSGSGTQLVAAERMGRICYAMELMPHFVAVALERLSELGLTPERQPAPVAAVDSEPAHQDD